MTKHLAVSEFIREISLDIRLRFESILGVAIPVHVDRFAEVTSFLEEEWIKEARGE